MKDEEFVKLKFFIDAELTMIRVFLAFIVGLIAANWLAWIFIGFYMFYSILYAAVRLNYVERKHRGYTRVPRI